MRKNLLSFFIFLGAVSTPASAQEYSPDPLERAPEKEIECSWSKSNSDELKDCLKKKEFFQKMSPEEKKSYNREVKIRELEHRIERLEKMAHMHRGSAR